MEEEKENVASLPADIVRTHVIDRLDGPSLASVSSVSSAFRSFTADDHLWENVCVSTWPSISDPRVSNAISSFRKGYRSFFFDSCNPISFPRSGGRRSDGELKFLDTTRLISAVDVFYNGEAIFSKVLEIMVAKNDLFSCSPFRVDLQETKEFAHQWDEQLRDSPDSWLQEVQNNVTLSWILIDPVSGRAVNLSSGRPVMSQRHWMAGDIQLKFAVVMEEVEERKKGMAWVDCETVITLGGWKEGDGIHVKEVCMGIEDMEGGVLSGKESLGILLNAMARGTRKRRTAESHEKIFEEFLRRKQSWNSSRKRKEKIIDIASNFFGAAIVFLFWLWLFGLFR